ncbi:MAG: TetR/AcrR family transcriptional regulator [Sphingomonas bacterium]|uniref:TetR/AcrR family transcriptional regulator n=1 Tax=Sphingomonas bacterium TaxID=1895847 RepID=UPI00261B84AE|nr:TetR/AcrR family transcriptional regulator [Sphingomonas bacterium]MDB5711666.1 TetR/AcrR family transcriptional regulator [Sphingomonas bacterium]
MITVSTSEKRTYHHGDLRAAAITAGLELLKSRTADDLGLREVARAVGTSATALYRHFPDKAALLRALAGEGLHRLGVAQRAASDAAGGGAAGFSATGSAYVRFALDNPALFRLIFANPMPHDKKTQVPADPDDAMAMLQANAAALAPAGMDPRIFALQSWSIAHGLAMLILDRQLHIDDATIDAVIDGHMAQGAD